MDVAENQAVLNASTLAFQSTFSICIYAFKY